ncbi:CpaF family protein [Leucobacter sp. GX24907]
MEDGVARLWIDRSGALELIEGWQASPAALRRLAVALVSAGGRHIDELHPCADVRLGDGIRVHAVLPPLSVSGTAVSIRVPGLQRPAFSDLVAAGLCDDERADWLCTAMAERRNLLLSGGTGTGKTTVLAALLDLAPDTERILTIEDVAELRLRHRHTVSLEARQANTEGAGEITLDRLLRESLRMRPDRIVLGECRGPEVVTLLAALNTGHDGGAGTLHASRIVDVPTRLEALGMLAGLAPDALARQAVSGLHAVVHLERRRGKHRIADIAGFVLRSDGGLGLEPMR